MVASDYSGRRTLAHRPRRAERLRSAPRPRVGVWLALALAFAVGGCALSGYSFVSDEEFDRIVSGSGGAADATGGRSESGGDGDATGGVQIASGGSPTGGAAVTGGDDPGGDATGGDELGGGPTGGDDTGGDATGGDATGGTATGGDATGGDATGGDDTGGTATGGTATGGTATGGAGTGGGTNPSPGCGMGTPITTSSLSTTTLIISEYVEGTSNNKALELFNGTGADVALGDCEILVYYNAAGSAGDTIELADVTLADGETWVLCEAGVGASVPCSQCDANLDFNGNDVVELVCGVNTLDVFGKISEVLTRWGAGDTASDNHTLRRKCSVSAGDTNSTDAFDPATQWDGFAVDTFGGLGVHCP